MHTRYGNISLHDRPELVRYMRVLDLKHIQVDDNESQRPTDPPWVASPITAIEDIAREASKAGLKLHILDIDVIRVPSQENLIGLGPPPQVGFIRAKRTMYFVDMDASHGYGETHIHLAPIAGSQETIVNLRYDPSNPDLRYGNVFLLSGPPKSTIIMFSTYSRPLPTQVDSEGTSSSTDPPELAIEIAHAVCAGVVWGPPDAHLTVVGVDDWPLDWFSLGFGEEMRHGEQESAFRGYFEGSYDELIVKKLGTDYDFTETESEIDEEMAYKLRFVSLREYEEAWSSLHPDGISILLRP